jgi:S-DNA-T family DNA segregation ATPase FtsK/SpoIIIE
VSVLPPDPELELPAGEDAPSVDGLWLPLGPGGDDGTALGIDLHRSGGLLVVGPPGSGRTSALRAFARHCVSAGAAVAELGPAHAPGSTADRSGERPTCDEPIELGRRDPEALQAWLTGQDGRRPVVVVVDDLMTLPEPVADLLTAAPPPPARLFVLAAGSAAELAGSFRGPAVALRRNRTVLFLRPAAGDAELFGLRSPRSPLPPRPGAGWLVTPTAVTRVQVARRRRPARSS